MHEGKDIYGIERVDGFGAPKTVNRSELRKCENQKRGINWKPEQLTVRSTDKKPIPSSSSQSEYELQVEKIQYNYRPDSENSSDNEAIVRPDNVESSDSEVNFQPDSEDSSDSEQFIRRTSSSRVTAGKHSNRHRYPRSAVKMIRAKFSESDYW